MAEELDENNDIPGQVKEEEDYDSGDDDKSESEFSDSDEDEGDSDTGLTENQNRLLYLISLYSHAAQTEEEKEEWIRRQALMVLCYEGIVAQVLDYDYALLRIWFRGDASISILHKKETVILTFYGKRN